MKKKWKSGIKANKNSSCLRSNFKWLGIVCLLTVHYQVLLIIRKKNNDGVIWIFIE